MFLVVALENYIWLGPGLIIYYAFYSVCGHGALTISWMRSFPAAQTFSQWVFSLRKWFFRIKMLKNHLLVPWTLYLMVRKEDFLLLLFQYGYSAFSVMIIGNCCYEKFFLESCLVIICLMTIINNQSSFLSPKYAY